MEMLPLLLLCVVPNSAPTHYRRDNDVSRHSFHSYENTPRRATKYENEEQYSGEDDTVKRERELFQWLRQMVGGDRGKHAPKYDATDEKAGFRDVERNLTEVLTHLSEVLHQILNVVKYSKRDEFREANDYLPQTGLDKNTLRIKRNAGTNGTATEVPPENATEAANRTSGRRMGELVTADEIRSKLFTYVEEGFTEMKHKVDSLMPIKNAFNEDVNYKIGYIVANIDTLEANMDNLKMDLDGNRQVWEHGRVLNLYDTVKVSNNAVTNLLDVLKDLLEKDFSASGSK